MLINIHILANIGVGIPVDNPARKGAKAMAGGFEIVSPAGMHPIPDVGR